MKWTMPDPTNGKAASIPKNSQSRRSTGQFISALLRYSMKRKYEVCCESKHVGKLLLPPGSRRKSFGGIDTHQAKKVGSVITKEELLAIQIQLAILSDGDGDRPIHIAVANENLKLVQKLCFLMIKNAISLDITNYLRQTPLHLAVMIGNLEIIQLLLNFGASPTVCDRNGNSVLHLAVKSHNDKEVLQLLLSHPKVKNILNSMDYEGYSALHYAVFKNNTNAVQMLQNFGADMNRIDGKSGRTALIHAVLEQNINMVDLLLSCRACPQKVDYSGRSAFEMALQITNGQIITLLEKWMPSSESMTVKEQTKPTTRYSAKTRRTKN